MGAGTGNQEEECGLIVRKSRFHAVRPQERFVATIIYEVTYKYTS